MSPVKSSLSNPKDTRLMLDRLVDALKEVYEINESFEGSTTIAGIIENILDVVEEKYGKNAKRDSN